MKDLKEPIWPYFLVSSRYSVLKESRYYMTFLTS